LAWPRAQDASPGLLATTALLTLAAMLTVVAIKQKESRDKRFLLARCSVAIICSAKRCS